ncbi:MAG TPA: isovaleryl-CoA dehydrogenase [Pyrinomonadaceae bacterium]|nr:isovaleryl-CoA dehydrogenase [Pyrinomonadaceae bacterium]
MKADEFAARAPDEVLNQPPALENYNLYECDRSLREAVAREGGGWVEEQAREFGALLGKAETLKLGELANRHPPVLHTHDRFGNRIDEVEFHPAWHELMRLGISHGTHSLPWTSNTSGAHVARAALMMLSHQVEEGHSCPITMTFAVMPSLRIQPELAAEWEPRVLSNEYDPRFIPAPEKRGALFGMAMTERQGGSDVRSNTTRAVPVAKRGPGEVYQITGHKWFCSAPMSDAFLVLAQAPGGLSCLLLPRWRPDGSRNAFHIQRLKDKLGNRSNASSEVEFHGAAAWLIGEEGRGVANIIEMVRHTRLDCTFGSAATMRRAIAEVLHHAQHRYAFGDRLINQPLMKNVLADLCVEYEAALALALRLARSFDEATEESGRHFSRVATAVGKYWITKRAIAVVAEALECLGGNGYVEEAPLARLYRDVPLNSLWEGSGNVQCLDVLRAMQKEPETGRALFAELDAAQGIDVRYDEFLRKIQVELSDQSQSQVRARRIVESLGLALQASLLLKHGHPAVTEAFCSSRLTESHFAFGTLSPQNDFDAIIERSRPFESDY